jgi:hypothetical protein
MIRALDRRESRKAVRARFVEAALAPQGLAEESVRAGRGVVALPLELDPLGQDPVALGPGAGVDVRASQRHPGKSEARHGGDRALQQGNALGDAPDALQDGGLEVGRIEIPGIELARAAHEPQRSIGLTAPPCGVGHPNVRIRVSGVGRDGASGIVVGQCQHGAIGGEGEPQREERCQSGERIGVSWIVLDGSLVELLRFVEAALGHLHPQRPRPRVYDS